MAQSATNGSAPSDWATTIATTKTAAAPPPAAVAIAALDELKPPAGVVLPPRDIRTILEKTAGFVARNGAAFEQRVREKEKQNPRFSFLVPADAYHAFYQWRLGEIREGRGTAVAAGRVGESSSVGGASLHRSDPVQPPDFVFSARMPHINQKDLDVVRMTALFVAQQGRTFMTQLTHREASKPQFQFLIPNHTFHNFFQHLVDQYTILLRESGLDGEGGRVQHEKVVELQANVTDKFRILARARQRADYARFQKSQKQKKEEEEERKKVEFDAIDWNNFVVVETIVFTESDTSASLPPPTSLSELQYASLEERKMVKVNANMRIEEALPTDDDMHYNARGPTEYYRTAARIVPTTYTAPTVPFIPRAPGIPGELPKLTNSAQQPPQPTILPLPNYPSPAPTPNADEEENARMRELSDSRERIQQAQAKALSEPSQFKIKENYIPKAAQRAIDRQENYMGLCPHCKQMVPLNEMEEHVRIELLDPNWKEQKAKADARFATTNFSTIDVASNLKRLASQRGDVFSNTAPGSNPFPAIPEDEARRKMAAVVGPSARPEPVPVGVAVVPMPTPLNVDEQIRAIHERFAKETRPT